MDPFEALDLKPAASQGAIRRSWLAICSGWRPGQPQSQAYQDAMAAAASMLHMSAEFDSDWLPVLVDLVDATSGHIRDTPDIEDSQIYAVADQLKLAPKTVTHERMASSRACAEALELVQQLLPLEEFAVARDLASLDLFDICWKPHGMTGRGTIIHASMAIIPSEQRDVWPTQHAPVFRLRISLPYWLLADATERERLIHHELAHAVHTGGVAKLRPHDIEENLETAMRYGARDIHHARLMASAIHHPRTQAMLRADPEGQMTLPLAGTGLKPRTQIEVTINGKTL